MHDLVIQTWPYRLIRIEEFERFRADMELYYVQLAARSVSPPTLDDIIGSPAPFFFEFLLKSEGGAYDLDDLTRFAAAERDSRQFRDYREDVVTHYAIYRYTHDREHAKGGGFTCLNC